MKIIAGIQKLHDDVCEAKGRLEEIQADLARITCMETDARNRLNKAQKVFDDFVDEMKAKAPRESDWGEHK